MMPDFRSNMLEVTSAVASGVTSPQASGDVGFGVDTRGFAYIKDSSGNISFLPRNVSCQAHNSADVSIPHNTLTALALDSERYDTANMHSTSSNTSRITVPYAGLYNILGSADFLTNATGRRYSLARLNGTTNQPAIGRMHSPSASFQETVSFSYQMVLSANDYIELMVYQSSGGALSVAGNTGFLIVSLAYPL